MTGWGGWVVARPEEPRLQRRPRRGPHRAEVIGPRFHGLARWGWTKAHAEARARRAYWRRKAGAS